jgi:hypothetical protein
MDCDCETADQEHERDRDVLNAVKQVSHSDLPPSERSSRNARRHVRDLRPVTRGALSPPDRGHYFPFLMFLPHWVTSGNPSMPPTITYHSGAWRPCPPTVAQIRRPDPSPHERAGCRICHRRPHPLLSFVTHYSRSRMCLPNGSSSGRKSQS